MESLGGPATPAVGWAAGIERLAMLVGESEDPSEIRLDTMISVESDEALPIATNVLSRLRRGGISAEMIATGSPRKRFDKAVKANAKTLLVLDFQTGRVAGGLRGDEGLAANVRDILAGLFDWKS
jgi:histidyl-tRNA synthetase